MCFILLEKRGKTLPSVGREEEIVVEGKESFAGYQSMLENLYPDSKRDIAAFMEEIRRITTYVDVLYGIDNPTPLSHRKADKQQ